MNAAKTGRNLASHTLAAPLIALVSVFSVFSVACGNDDAAAVWASDSEKIEIRCDSYWGGKLAIVADRESLNSQQEMALALLTTQPSGKVRCEDADQDFCEVQVMGPEVSSTTYEAEGHSECGNLTYPSVMRVLDTFGCVRTGGEGQAGPLVSAHGSAACR